MWWVIWAPDTANAPPGCTMSPRPWPAVRGTLCGVVMHGWEKPTVTSVGPAVALGRKSHLRWHPRTRAPEDQGTGGPRQESWPYVRGSGTGTVQTAKTWATVFGVACPPACTIPVQVVGLTAPACLRTWGIHSDHSGSRGGPAHPDATPDQLGARRTVGHGVRGRSWRIRHGPADRGHMNQRRRHRR